MKNAHHEARMGAFAFPGFYVRIVLTNINFNMLSKHPNNKPLVIFSHYLLKNSYFYI
jgi:hypothetical protein